MRVEQTVRAQAKELAGAFYENNRTDKFRRAFPTFKHFMHGVQVMYDSKLNVTGNKKVAAGWTHFIALARKTLTVMLGASDARVAPAIKERIYDALLEDRANIAGRKAHRVKQRTHLDG